MFAVFFLPSLLFAASLKITEIMYNQSGSDQGGEWIEVLNIDEAPVDLATFRFFEGGTSHSIKAGRGQNLLPGERAVVASDAVVFLSLTPSYAGALFDSAFSLSNEGETLELRDAKGKTLDRVSYSSSKGADGDGTTLQYWNGSWKALVSTPGRDTDGTALSIAKPLPKVETTRVAKNKISTTAKTAGRVTTVITKPKIAESPADQSMALEAKAENVTALSTRADVLAANAALAVNSDSYFWPALSSALALAALGSWVFVGRRKKEDRGKSHFHDPAPDITIIE
jgi:hypothetical protein